MPRHNRNFKKKRKEKKKIIYRKKVCRFCMDKELVIDYKFARQLSSFLTERGKIVPRRMTGNCAYHQRRVEESIKRARILALIPYTINHANI